MKPRGHAAHNSLSSFSYRSKSCATRVHQHERVRWHAGARGDLNIDMWVLITSEGQDDEMVRCRTCDITRHCMKRRSACRIHLSLHRYGGGSCRDTHESAKKLTPPVCASTGDSEAKDLSHYERFHQQETSTSRSLVFLVLPSACF